MTSFDQTPCSDGLHGMELSAADATATTHAMEISVDTMLTAGAATTAGAAATAAVTTTMGSATSGAADPSLLSAPAATVPLEPVAWDAHLENPSLMSDPSLNKEMQMLRRAALGLTSPRVHAFIEGCEFVSLGCFCAPSYGMQLLGVKKNSYPFDWVRSTMEGIIHCVENEFEDFLTYSTFWVQDAYTVFGGTRWGGSFWHHNLEAPLTREDRLG